MADIIKLDMTDIWASGGDKVAPTPTKIAQGWLVEVVPRQTWNWFENRQDQNIAYLLQKGFPEWDTFTEYVASKSWVNYSGIIYKAILTGTNKIPTSQPTYWVKAFPESSASLEALRVLTPAADRVPYFTNGTTAALATFTAFARTLVDDVDAAAARTTLSAQLAHANLTGLASVTGGVNVLPYFNGTSTMTGTNLTAFARTFLDDVDAPTARTTLGLGTSAVVDITTTDIDTTLGRATKVGDFGIGAGATVSSKFVPTWPNTSLDNITGVASGIYRTVTGTTNSINGQAAIVIFAVQNSDAVRATQLTISTDSGGSANSMVFRSCTGGTLAAPTWSTAEDMASKAEVYAQMAEFGLGDVNSPLITDLNTPAVTGWNRFTNSAANIPLAGASGVVQTSVYTTATYRTQLCITVQSTDATRYNRLFTRTMNSGTWGVWKEMVDAATLATTLTGYAQNGANTDITSLTGISLNGVNGLTGQLSSNTGDATTVPSSGGTLVTPKIRLSDAAANAASVQAIQGYSFTTANFGSTLVGTRSYGAVGAHAAVAADRSVFTLLGAASDGTKYNPIGRIDYYTVNTQSGTNAGGEIRFLTTPINTLVPTLSATIRSNGDLAVVGAISAAALSLTTALPISSGGTGGTTAAAARIQLQAVGYDATTGSATLPAGTTAQRTGSPSNGQLRYNSDNNEFEGFINGSWGGIGGGTPLFTVLWWPSRAAIPAGYFPADGQLLTRTAYSAAWARISAGDVPLTSDAIWNSNAIYRGYYSGGNGSTTFRVPDINGKVASGYGAVFLRGDGLNSTGLVGQIQDSNNLAHSHAVYDPGHTHYANISANEAGSTGAYNGRVNQGRAGDGSYSDNQPTGIGVSFTNVSLYNSGIGESRPSNITGVYIIKLIGGASDLSKEDASVAVAALDAVVYKRSNVIGTVSMSAGIPTGSIFETGVNANGRYIKFADGTMICTSSGTGSFVSATLPANTSTEVIVPLPATFSGVPAVQCVAGPTLTNDHYGATNSYIYTSTQIGCVIRNGATAQTFAVRYIAVGRWY